VKTETSDPKIEDVVSTQQLRFLESEVFIDILALHKSKEDDFARKLTDRYRYMRTLLPHSNQPLWKSMRKRKHTQHKEWFGGCKMLKKKHNKSAPSELDFVGMCMLRSMSLRTDTLQSQKFMQIILNQTGSSWLTVAPKLIKIKKMDYPAFLIRASPCFSIIFGRVPKATVLNSWKDSGCFPPIFTYSS